MNPLRISQQMGKNRQIRAFSNKEGRHELEGGDGEKKFLHKDTIDTCLTQQKRFKFTRLTTERKF